MIFETLNLWIILAGGALFLLVERLPRFRSSAASAENRWLTNIGLMLIGGVATGLVTPDSVLIAAEINEAGLLKQLPLPLAVEIVLVFLILDCWRYWEHRIFHEVPLLWRMHLVHHSDTALDITTGQRHHPLESMLTAPVMFILLFSLGFSPWGLGLYFVMATISSLYTHTSLRLPDKWDRILSPWVVTPTVHRVHHSAYQRETDSNYGSVFSFWDRLFGTYIDPTSNPIPIVGLAQFRQSTDTTLGAALVQPFEFQPAQESESNVLAAVRQVSTDAHSQVTTTALTPQWQTTLWTMGIGLGVLLVVAWPSISELVAIWNRSDAYKYAWLVVPTFIYLAGWYHRDNILQLNPSPGYPGLGLALVAAATWVFASLADINFGIHLALVLAAQALALSALGWQAYRKLLPLMGLLFFLIPCGDIIQPLLRTLTVKWIEWFCMLAGLPVEINGFTLQVGEFRYVVIDACSGLSIFTLAAFLGYSFGLMIYRSLYRVLALAALSAAIGILSNALRVCLIVWLDQAQGTQMSLADHQDIQLPLLLTTIGLLLYLANKLNHESWAFTEQALPSIRGYARYTPIYAAILVSLFVGLSYRAVIGDMGGSRVDNLASLSRQHPQANLIQLPQSGAPALAIPLEEIQGRLIVVPLHPESPLPSKILRPRDGYAWRHAATFPYRECADENCWEFVHLTWNRKGSRETRHALYTYYLGDQTTPSKLKFRLTQGWKRLLGEPSSTGIIAIQMKEAPPRELVLNRSIALRQLLVTTAPTTGSGFALLR